MKSIYFLMIIITIFTTACNSSNSNNPKVVTIATVGGSPDGVTVADSGNIYITDIDSGTISQIDTDGNVTVIKDTTPPVTIIEPDGITAITSGSTDILYIADAGTDGTGTTTDGAIIKIEVTSDGTVTTTEFLNDDILTNPTGIASDNSGNLYVADQGTGHVYRINIDGSGNYISTENLTTATTVISEPHGLTLVTNEDDSITLYTTDQGSTSNNVVQIDIPASGSIASVIVTELTADNTGGSATGSTSNAQFNKPHGITSDTNGAVFVCDENNNRVQIITPGGNVVTFAGNGASGDTDGDADNAQFNKPRGLAIDANGDLLVCDYGNGKVKKIIR